MKIAVVTLTGTNDFNFGNSLQNYALVYILEQLGGDVETILQEYNCLHGNGNYFYWCWHGINVKTLKFFIKFLINHDGIRYKLMKHLSRKRSFHEFEKKYIKYSNIKLKNNDDDFILNNMYDYFVVGSDQIWATPDESSFLLFADNSKRIAYAPSFGISCIEQKYIKKYRKLISGIKHLSVRELAGAKIIKSLTNKEASVLVDPTMLLNKAEWSQLAKKPFKFNEQRYILVYFLGDLSKDIENTIKKLAKDQNLEIVNLLEQIPSQWYNSVGPAEFIFLIKNATFVFTDSFHGTVFSIIMKIPFLVFSRVQSNIPIMNSRIDNILTRFDLNNRRGEKYINNIGDEKVFSINFDTTDCILTTEKNKSILYLKNALNL